MQCKARHQAFVTSEEDGNERFDEVRFPCGWPWQPIPSRNESKSEGNDASR
jgi:hypothetical protein